MLSGSVPRVVAVVAAALMALAGLLPFQHLHADDHEAVVHRHVIGDASEHHDGTGAHGLASLDHEDHADARLLFASYVTVGSFALAAPFAVTATASAESPRGRAIPLVGTTLLPTHDPPIRFISSPAPPARV